MKTIVDSQGHRLPQQQIEEKISTALMLLCQRQPERADQLRALAGILRDHTPLSFFVAPTTDRLAEWVEQFDRFLARRDSRVMVDCFSLAPGDRSFLVTNTPDVPYLLHTVQLCLSRLGVRFQVVCHPIISVHREGGEIVRLGPAGRGGDAESLIVIELEDIGCRDIPELLKEVRRRLELVLLVAADDQKLRQQLNAVGHCRTANHDFWSWLEQGAFLPLSYKRLTLSGSGDAMEVLEEADSALGIPWKMVQVRSGESLSLSELPGRFQSRIHRPTAEVVEESDRRSPIFRDEPLVYVGCRDGSVEHVFLGLFVPEELEKPTLGIPALKNRMAQAFEQLCIPAGSHDYRKITEIFNSFPKTEMFFMADEELFCLVRSFTQLYRHASVKVVPAHSLAVRGLTLMMIMPRDFYTPQNMSRMEKYLKRFFSADGVVTRVIHMAKSYLSLHVSIQKDDFDIAFDAGRLERGLTRLSRPWDLCLEELLDRRFEPCRRDQLLERYRDAFPIEYRHLTHPRFALRDIQAIEQLFVDGEDSFALWGPLRDPEEFFRLQFYSLRQSYLNELMPFLENLGVNVIDEVDFSLVVDQREVFIKSFAIRGGAGSLPLSPLRDKLVAALTALRRGDLENDYLNRLLVLSGLDWKQIDLFRAYRNYYFQLGSPYSKRRVAFSLINNPQVAALLYNYFEARFKPDERWQDPLEREEQALSPIRMELIAALQQVQDPNEDEILRIMFNLIDSTIRSNFFLRRDAEDYFLAFKISAIGIIDMPAPRPLYETYVHSAKMEGIHLRGGKVARGGIRWSDRPDDFRTEILGLMKTQMTKNALIVPVGSKGGFIVKTPFSNREEGGTLSKAAYQTLMRGLLDLCDNRVGTRVVRPRGIVAYDGEDPYLVVAADKGTAHLPDTANAISCDYGFWLGDAFASGGSRGYDHKKLGITARGAWECVKRHFRELGTDIQSEPVTVVGIGDMGGDVFGNGMLLSKKLKLLAAFNHLHIFLDPDPDPEVSWAERKRLFELPRSSWEDYNPQLISRGGGVFSRSAKDIPLSPEVRKWLGVKHDSIDPNGLISLLLTAPVDLLWNGGIGTYVKASDEKHSDAGDRANDALRIDATQLRARVIGEGGNLGMTQKARIEYALGGGRLNTDAIDNSAGVDCSDHEVNLKIFLHHLIAEGKLKDEQQRDRLLAEVTDDVCRLVLKNNYTQSLCLSMDLERCGEDAGPFLDLADRLTDAGLLDRKGEGLPSAKQVMARADRSLTRPELSILLAYAKMQLYQALLESDLPEDELAGDDLKSYFPPLMQKRFGKELAGHPLAREIIATVVTNRIVDQAGACFCDRLVRGTGAGLVAIARTYLFFDRLLQADNVRDWVYSRDNRMTAEQQHQLLRLLESHIAELCRTALAVGFPIVYSRRRITALRRQFEEYCASLSGTGTLPVEVEDMPPEVAAGLTMLTGLDHFLPVVVLAGEAKKPLPEVVDCYRAVRKKLDLDPLLDCLSRVAVKDRWGRLGREALRTQIDAHASQIARKVLQQYGGRTAEFFNARRSLMQTYRAQRKRLGAAVPDNLHPFMVLVGSINRLLNEA